MYNMRSGAGVGGGNSLEPVRVVTALFYKIRKTHSVSDALGTNNRCPFRLTYTRRGEIKEPSPGHLHRWEILNSDIGLTPLVHRITCDFFFFPLMVTR